MKKCPECSRTYSDETLSFCLEDGALLSASTNFQKTQPLYNAKDILPPTVAINEVEVPTRAAQKILQPTVAVGEVEVPTRADDEIPTLVKLPKVTEVAENRAVQWYVYLLGLFISWIIYFTSYNYLFDVTVIPLGDLVIPSISNLMGDALAPYYNFLFTTLFNLLFYGIIAMALGFIWSGAKWRWGLIAVVLPAYALISIIPHFNNFTSIVVSELIIYFLTILFACLGSYAGSRLKSRV